MVHHGCLQTTLIGEVARFGKVARLFVKKFNKF